MPSSHREVNLSHNSALAVYGRASGLVHSQPKPGFKYTILIGPGWDAKQVTRPHDHLRPHVWQPEATCTHTPRKWYGHSVTNGGIQCLNVTSPCKTTTTDNFWKTQTTLVVELSHSGLYEEGEVVYIHCRWPVFLLQIINSWLNNIYNVWSTNPPTFHVPTQLSHMP